ncbi:helix-turn-helix transcriptional regulator [Ruegeria arenilitoris]|uniref:helix-turn-helix transcriptional regulator n=1 Tax=Ruegeria arenilitoris TaxID=1173585 RepID=UPI0014811523|nr:hypothetical protein [Ruegeria arenilitoris]
MDDPILQKFLADHGLITEEQVAALEGCELVTIETRRSRGEMPPFYRQGNRTFYEASDIADLIRSKRKDKNRKRAAGSQDLLNGAA